jgi:hypothetical protein
MRPWFVPHAMIFEARHLPDRYTGTIKFHPETSEVAKE